MGPVTSSSSALRLAKSSAGGLPLLCRASVVGGLGLLSGVSETSGKAVFHAVVAFAINRPTDTQREKKTYQTVIGCGHAGVLKQQIPKFMGNERTNNVTCSSITMST